MRLSGACCVGVFLLTGFPNTTTATSDVRLVDATARQDAAAVRQLINEGLDVNASRADGVTALLWAAHWDEHKVAKLLLEAGANANMADDHGVTPLIRASENASIGMVKALLAAGADASIAQVSGLTPLMVAAHTGSIEVVQALLGHGAVVNAATDEMGATALMWAIAAPHRDIVMVLLENDAAVGVSSAKGMTPLLTAARSGDIETAKLLIAAGAGVNDLGSDGTHALPFAIINGQEAFALFLLEQGADPNGTIDGISALHAAVGNVDTWLNHWDRRHGAETLGGVRRNAGRPSFDPVQRLLVAKALLVHGADPDARITTTASPW